MSKSSTTVRDVFELPEPGAEGTDDWKAFKTRVSKEVKGIKTAALPDLAKKVAELFEIPIPDIFLNSWKKAEGIKTLLEESRNAPETVMSAELGEHTINSQHRPQIEIRIQNKTVKKLEFTLKLVFNLKGFVLKIKDGRIREMQTGSCEVRGKMEYQGLLIADKKLAPITLPGAISFERGLDSAEKVVVVGEKPSAVEATSSASGSAEARQIPVAGAVEEPSKEVAAVVEEARVNRDDSAEIQDAQPRDELKESATTEIIQSTSSEPVAVEAVNPAPETVAVTEDSEGVIASEPEAPVVHPTPEPVDEAEERTTWEVGDDDADSSSPADSSVKSETDENAEDIISRMSRELAEKRQST